MLTASASASVSPIPGMAQKVEAGLVLCHCASPQKARWGDDRLESLPYFWTSTGIRSELQFALKMLNCNLRELAANSCKFLEEHAIPAGNFNHGRQG